MDLADDLRLALDTSDRAAELALTHFEAGVSATRKADGTPVTIADRAVERLIRAELGAARPDDALLGEELGEVGRSDRVWIIDPVDGTSYFSRRDPHWRVHLALAVAGRIEVAVVTAPALGRCWWAVRGGGAFESTWPRAGSRPSALAVSTVDTLPAARPRTLDPAGRGGRRPLHRPGGWSSRRPGWPLLERPPARGAAGRARLPAPPRV